MMNSDIKINVIGNYSPSNHDASRIVDKNGLAPTVKENHGTVTAIVCEQRRDEGIRFFQDDLCGTLRTIDACGDKRIIEADSIINKGGRDRMINGNIRIRKLTPSECFKLMGFSSEDCKRAADGGISNSQLYKQAGNSIVVDVLEAIFTRLGSRYEEFRSVS